MMVKVTDRGILVGSFAVLGAFLIFDFRAVAVQITKILRSSILERRNSLVKDSFI